MKRLPTIQKQAKVQEEIKRVYDNILEQQKYLKRQLEAHAAIHNNVDNNANPIAPNQPEMYLQRRKLNIEEDEQREFHSDEEEEKAQERDEYEKLFRQPQPQAVVNSLPDLEEAKDDRRPKKDSDLRAGMEYKPREIPASRQFLDPNGNPQRNVPIYELDEIWQIPEEFDELSEDAQKPKGKVMQPEHNVEKYAYNRRNRNELQESADRHVVVKTKYIFEE